MVIKFLSRHSLLVEHKTGVQIHDLNILKSLIALGHDVKILDYSSREQYGDLDLEKYNDPEILSRVVFSKIVSRYSKRMPLSIAFGKNAPRKGDIVIIDSYVPFFLNKKSTHVCVVLHDLMPLIMPEYYDDKGYYELYYKKIGCCDEIWANSNSTKSDYNRYYPNATAKLRIVPCSIKTNFEQEMRCMAPLANRTWEDKEYFFYIGDMRKNKNIEMVIRAFESFCLQDREKYLIIAGKKVNEYEKLQNLVNNSLILRDRVIFPGYISEEEKASLIVNAFGLVFVSSYEGFGIPIIEAMACGIPVMTSNTSSMKEIGENAAILVDPTSIPQIAEGFKEMCDVSKREQMVEMGYKRCKKYTIDNQMKLISDFEIFNISG